ncbi:MAG: hypothetical protein RL187_60, partial [Actinomycetota bacterium]
MTERESSLNVLESMEHSPKKSTELRQKLMEELSIKKKVDVK